MKHTARLLGLLCAILLTAPVAVLVAGDSDPADPKALEGRWQVDLRPTPDAEPYFQEMVIREIADGAFTGTFYGTKMRDGRLNSAWGAVHFAFVTEDRSGKYHSSGTLRDDGRLEGRTHALDRGFLSVWSAERLDE